MRPRPPPGRPVADKVAGNSSRRRGRDLIRFAELDKTPLRTRYKGAQGVPVLGGLLQSCIGGLIAGWLAGKIVKGGGFVPHLSCAAELPGTLMSGVARPAHLGPSFNATGDWPILKERTPRHWVQLAKPSIFAR
jgi:hypothetical protein